ncbi:MAG TPA: RNA polymerase sigma factor [Planctomycetota bacterium]|nr:RNA polymerase sigma factor [Planctomycetota bacterium]
MALGTMPPPTTDARFAAFLQQARPRALQFLTRLCGSEAEDVLQETLAKVWRLRARFDARQNGEAWLLQAAFRTFCDHRARRQPPVADTGAVEAVPTPALPCRLELRDEVRHCLAALPPLERALLLGFHAHGRSLRELAAEHGLPLNTVKSHLHRARTRLQGGRSTDDAC